MAGSQDRSAASEAPREDQAGADPGQDPGRGASGDERARAAAYLDLWERHVAQAAVHGLGLAKPWFGR